MRSYRSFGLFAVVGVIVFTVCLAFASNPAWWTSRGVLATGSPTNDYAAVNQGQLKHIATQARAEMDAQLPGGAGSNIVALINSFSTTNNYFAVNIGQLKAVAKPFYDRLIQVGYTSGYPWNTATTTNDYAIANIGQVKNLFSWDLVTWLALDSDADGLINSDELNVYGTDPANADTDGDGMGDGFEVQYLLNPLSNADAVCKPRYW